jgi:hypothetical protein
VGCGGPKAGARGVGGDAGGVVSLQKRAKKRTPASKQNSPQMPKPTSKQTFYVVGWGRGVLHVG